MEKRTEISHFSATAIMVSFVVGFLLTTLVLSIVMRFYTSFYTGGKKWGPNGSLLAANKWPFRLHATYDESISRFLNVFERGGPQKLDQWLRRR